MKIQCILPDFWNTKVIVSGKEYAIDAEGMLDVANEEHAKMLLGNTGKYESLEAPSSSRPKPGQRPRPTPILEDRLGNELSEGETLALVEKIEKKEPEVGAKDDEPEPGEPAADEESPKGFPPIGMHNTKAEMLDVLHKLKKAGAEVTFKESDTKVDLLEQIQQAYDAMTD